MPKKRVDKSVVVDTSAFIDIAKGGQGVVEQFLLHIGQFIRVTPSVADELRYFVRSGRGDPNLFRPIVRALDEGGFARPVSLSGRVPDVHELQAIMRRREGTTVGQRADAEVIVTAQYDLDAIAANDRNLIIEAATRHIPVTSARGLVIAYLRGYPAARGKFLPLVQAIPRLEGFDPIIRNLHDLEVECRRPGPQLRPLLGFEGEGPDRRIVYFGLREAQRLLACGAAWDVARALSAQPTIPHEAFKKWANELGHAPPPNPYRADLGGAESQRAMERIWRDLYGPGAPPMELLTAVRAAKVGSSVLVVDRPEDYQLFSASIEADMGRVPVVVSTEGFWESLQAGSFRDWTRHRDAYWSGGSRSNVGRSSSDRLRRKEHARVEQFDTVTDARGLAPRFDVLVDTDLAVELGRLAVHEPNRLHIIKDALGGGLNVIEPVDRHVWETRNDGRSPVDGSSALGTRHRVSPEMLDSVTRIAADVHERRSAGVVQEPSDEERQRLNLDVATVVKARELGVPVVSARPGELREIVNVARRHLTDESTGRHVDVLDIEKLYGRVKLSMPLARRTRFSLNLTTIKHNVESRRRWEGRRGRQHLDRQPPDLERTVSPRPSTMVRDADTDMLDPELSALADDVGRRAGESRSDDGNGVEPHDGRGRERNRDDDPPYFPGR